MKHMNRMAIATGFTALGTLAVYATCYYILTTACTTAGAEARRETNPSDGCADVYYWNSDSDNLHAVALSSTPWNGYQQPVQGKTGYVDGTRQYMGTWDHDYYVPKGGGYCRYEHTTTETTTWNCENDNYSPDATDCSGYIPL